MKWSEKEEKILIRLYPRWDLTKFDIAEILTNRTPSAISKHASEMNLKKEYTPKINIDKLREVELFEI